MSKMFREDESFSNFSACGTPLQVDFLPELTYYQYDWLYNNSLRENFTLAHKSIQPNNPIVVWDQCMPWILNCNNVRLYLAQNSQNQDRIHGIHCISIFVSSHQKQTKKTKLRVLFHQDSSCFLCVKMKPTTWKWTKWNFEGSKGTLTNSSSKNDKHHISLPA